MIAKQVHMNYIKENEKEQSHIFRKNIIYFLDTGQIEFKGVQIPSCEVIFMEENKFKERLSAEMIQLFNAIQGNVWEQRIFQDMLNLIAKTAQVMPDFNIKLQAPINGMQIITNESIIHLCRSALRAYVQDEDYVTAIGVLKTFIAIFNEMPAFDRLILDYLKGVTAKYDMLLESYLEAIDKEIDKRAELIFQGSHYKAWLAAKNAVTVFEKLKAMGRRSNELTKKKILWYSLIKQNAAQMEFVLHSGKK